MKEIFRDYIRKWAPVLVRPNFFGEHYPDWIVNIFTQTGFWHCQRRSGKKFVDVEIMLHKKHPPILMIHGEADDYIPVTHQKFLEKMDKRGEKARRLVVPKAGHNESVLLSRQAYEKNIAEFLQKIL
jgi:pimeloyl-ACP methyl ester carboxylesterase